jgi:hypothetical protein
MKITKNRTRFKTTSIILLTVALLLMSFGPEIIVHASYWKTDYDYDGASGTYVQSYAQGYVDDSWPTPMFTKSWHYSSRGNNYPWVPLAGMHTIWAALPLRYFPGTGYYVEYTYSMGTDNASGGDVLAGQSEIFTLTSTTFQNTITQATQYREAYARVVEPF